MTATVPTKQSPGILAKSLHVGERVAQAVVQTERVKDQFTHAIEDAKAEAWRTIKHTRHAVEDLTEETAHCIKRDPWRAVAYSVGAGVALGVLMGWAVTRRQREST